MAYVDDLYARQFLVADALAAMPREVPMHSWKNWTRRSNPAIPVDEADEARLLAGELRYLHMRHLQQTAIVAELVAWGIPPHRAGLWASMFTNGGQRGRQPGKLYAPPFETFLCARPDDAVATIEKVQRGEDRLAPFAKGDTLRAVNLVQVWINPLVQHLRAHFGLPVQEVH